MKKMFTQTKTKVYTITNIFKLAKFLCYTFFIRTSKFWVEARCS